MSILVDQRTKLVVQGLTGREGTFHSLRNRAYGTDVVAGVRAGKAGENVEGIPIFNTVDDAVNATAANATFVIVPAAAASDALYEAIDSSVNLIVCVTEGIPAHDMARIYAHLKRDGKVMIGPNCPGLISPGKANVGFIPHEVCMPGPVGLVSRSGTLTYQIMHELTQMGVGQSSCVGIGGDPIVGTSFIDILERFEQDPETKAVVLIGEIGGEEEEKAAKYIDENMQTPVVAYIAGFSAPPGKRMGHAGAIVSGSKGTATAKAEAFEAVGVKVGRSPKAVAELAKAAL